MKKVIATLLLWSLTLLTAYFVGNRPRVVSSVELSPEMESENSIIAEENDPVGPIRIPGPIERSLEDLLVLENDGERIYQFDYMVEQLDSESLPAFLEQILSLPECENKGKWINRLMEKWGELDPQAAAAFIEAWPGSFRKDMMGHMARGWARQDPRNAWEYMKIQSKDGRDFRTGIHWVIYETMQTDPNLVVEFINEVSDSQTSYILAMVMGIHTRAKGNFSEVLGSMSGITNVSDRRMAQKTLWQQWAHYKPEEAFFAYQSMEEGAEKQEALAGLMGGWASKDAQEALAFCMENIPEESQGAAIKEIVRQWAQNGDLEAATAFVETLPVNKNSDEAVNAIVGQMAREDAESAMAWVQSMQNEERVRQGQKDVIRYWGVQDFEKAQAFVMEIPPGEQKDEGLRSLYSSQVGIGRISDKAYSIIPLIEDQEMRDGCVVDLANLAVFEMPVTYRRTNTIDKERVAQEIINMPGITEEKRQEALAILGVEKPGG